MRPNGSDKKIIRGLEYIDDDIVSGVLGKLKPEGSRTNNRFARRGKWLCAAVAVAACAVLLALAIPKTTTIISNSDIFRPVGADGGSGQIEKSPEYDGSRGLLYEINEDGESASFVGYGSCTDETVYIASTYDGLPVTVMFMGNTLHYTPYNQSKVGNVRRLVISDTVKYVDHRCISECPNIESVYYGASVENIRGFNFSVGYGLKFSTVEVSPDNPYYSVKDNCIVDLRTKALVLATHKAVIPDDGSVEIIGMSAFAPASYWLCSVEIPEGVKIIDHFAFSGCDKLENVILPDSLEVIEYRAFGYGKSIKTLSLGVNLKAVDPLIFSGIYTPEVYYAGTVGQWEEVVKINLTLRQAVSGSSSGTKYDLKLFTVHCTDGDSDSQAGKTGQYNWRNFPEYKRYDIGSLAIYGGYFITSAGNVQKIVPSEPDTQ